MSKDIKSKENMKNIKIKDNTRNIKHFIKDKDISTKDSLKENDNKDILKSNPNIKAVNQVSNNAKAVAIESTRKTKSFINKKRKQRKQINIKEKSLLKISKESLDYSNDINAKTNKQFNKIMSQNDYRTKMKRHFTFKHQNKTKEAVSTASKSRYMYNKISDTIKITYTFMKSAVTSVSNIISLGTGFLLLIVISLFIGVFSSLSDNNLYGIAVSPLSKEVLAYTDIISKYTEQYEIEEFTPLVQAIMMCESKGLGDDPMNSSTFIYNEKYPDGIRDSEYSIDVGVQYLSDCLKKANVNEPSDIEQLYLAIQAYDYGIEYIDWAISYFDGYSRANAKVYLDIKKEETENKFDGNASYVSNVWIYYRESGSRIVEIAKAQIGNIGGRKYWEWYGFESRVEWCACFVSWCAHQSGNLEVTIPRFSGVEYGMNWYKERDKWCEKDYVALTGDVIFFDWDNDKNPDHVGIVEKTIDNKVYTIEGNSNDRCRNKVYNLQSSSILGYGISTLIPAF